MKKFFLSMLAAFTAIFFVSSEAVALPTCSGSPVKQTFLNQFTKTYKGHTQNWHNCFGRISFYETFREGEWRNGKLNGKCKIQQNMSYIGECKNGLKHGKGKTTTAIFEYVGQYKNNEQDGVGKYIFFMEKPHEYFGEFEDGLRNGNGVFTYLPNGSTYEGIWRNGKFIKAQKTKYSKKSSSKNVSAIKNAFIKLTEQRRKQLQSNLQGLGFYTSKIDGLYGKGTKGALNAYNNQNMGGADLNKEQNVNRLITAILAINSSPKKAPDANPDETYRVASG